MHGPRLRLLLPGQPAVVAGLDDFEGRLRGLEPPRGLPAPPACTTALGLPMISLGPLPTDCGPTLGHVNTAPFCRGRFRWTVALRWDICSAMVLTAVSSLSHRLLPGHVAILYGSRNAQVYDSVK